MLFRSVRVGGISYSWSGKMATGGCRNCISCDTTGNTEVGIAGIEILPWRIPALTGLGNNESEIVFRYSVSN